MRPTCRPCTSGGSDACRGAARLPRQDWSFSGSTRSRTAGKAESGVGLAAAASGRFARTVCPVGALALVVSVALLVAGVDRRAPTRGIASVEVTYVSPASLRAALVRHPAVLVQNVPELRVAEVRPSGDTATYIRSLRRLSGIVDARRSLPRAEAEAPGLTLGLISTPAGGAYEWQWYATGADRVPATVLAAAARTTIAIVDTGADLSTPALAGKVTAAYDVRSGSRSVDDVDGHGTFVASIAGGSTSDGGAVAGFGGAARLLVVKVGDGTAVSDVDVAAGIVRAVRSGARIVNVSIAGRSRSAAEASAVAYAARHGVLVVAAAGNDALTGNPRRIPSRAAPTGRVQGRRRSRPRRRGLRHERAQGAVLRARVVSLVVGPGHGRVRRGRDEGADLALRARHGPRRRCGTLRVRKRHVLRGAPGLGGGRTGLGGESAAHGPTGCGGARADGERPRGLVAGARIRGT